MFCTFTFDRGLPFLSGLLVLKFTAAVGVFTWAYFFGGVFYLTIMIWIVGRLSTTTLALGL